MVDFPCCDNSGGRFSITINGKRYQARGSATIKPTTFERTAEANSDGSMYVTTKPMPAEADLQFSDSCGLSYDELLGCHVDVTIRLMDMKRTFLFTRATLVGRPEIKTENGEISGIKIASANVSWFNSL